MHDPAKFGDTHRLLERSRDAWGWNWLDDATQDLRQGVRTLARITRRLRSPPSSS